LIAVFSTTSEEVTVDSPRGQPSLEFRIDWEVTRPASWSCGSCTNQGSAMIRARQVPANPAHRGSRTRLKPHRRGPAPRGSVQPIVSGVPPGLFVKERLAFWHSGYNPLRYMAVGPEKPERDAPQRGRTRRGEQLEVGKGQGAGYTMLCGHFHDQLADPIWEEGSGGVVSPAVVPTASESSALEMSAYNGLSCTFDTAGEFPAGRQVTILKGLTL
jgi:hypothetical protein